MTKEMFADCISIIKDLVGHEYLYFDTAVEVKTTPHSYPFAAWAASVSPDDKLYLMDANENWHPLELKDAGANLVIGSLYQRLRLMRVQYAKAS